MPPEAPTSRDLGLAKARYLQDRLHPQPGSEHYLHTKDLLEALKQLIPSRPGKVLDYGCGGSPYRSLFATDTYHRADLEGSENVDACFGEDSRLSLPDQAYDLVLSSQVLEHVPNPATYLSECRRVLQEEGLLLLSTHGTFADHGCPQDYHRWTREGLIQELERHGFAVEQAWTLTNGARALCYLLRTSQQLVLAKDWSLSGLLLRALRAPFRHVPALVDRSCERHFAGQAIQTQASGNGALYIGIIVLARKRSLRSTSKPDQGCGQA